MLVEISLAHSILAPGEIVASDDGTRQIIVYPLGLIHFSSFPKESLAIFRAIGEALNPDFDPQAQIDPSPPQPVELATAAVCRHMLSDGFTLLCACCIPPLESPTDPMAGAVVSSWIGQSIDPDFMNPEDQEAAQSEDDIYTPTTPLSLKCARLIAAGNHVDDIYRHHQIGFDGKPLPYPGWSHRRFEYQVKADEARRSREQAGMAQAVAMAISACLGGDRGGEAFTRYMEALRSI